MNSTLKKILCNWFSVNDYHNEVTIGSIGTTCGWGILGVIVLYFMIRGLSLVPFMFNGLNPIPPDDGNILQAVNFVFTSLGLAVDSILVFIALCWGLDIISKVEVTKCNREDKK